MVLQQTLNQRIGLDVVTQIALPSPVWLRSCCFKQIFPLPPNISSLFCGIRDSYIMHVFNSNVLDGGHLLTLKSPQYFNESKRLL